MLIEDFSVQMYTDVCFHVFRTVVQHLQSRRKYSLNGGKKIVLGNVHKCCPIFWGVGGVKQNRTKSDKADTGSLAKIGHPIILVFLLFFYNLFHNFFHNFLTKSFFFRKEFTQICNMYSTHLNHFCS